MRKSAEKLVVPILFCLGLLFLFPLIVTVVNSLMTEAEIILNYTAQTNVFDLLEGSLEKFQQIKLIPRPVSVDQYAEVLVRQPSYLVLLLNSFCITLPVTLGCLIVSLFTAYGFTIWEWKYKEVLFSVYIMVMLMPLQAVLVPNYIIADMLQIQNSYLAIILPGIFSPFGVFLMRQGLKNLPPAYLEAARMDGASNLHIFRYIVLPQMKSYIAALGMLTFVEYWNLVEQAIIFINDYAREPLSVYLSRLATGRMGLIFAASCVYMYFPLLFLALGQKDLKKGIEISGVK